MPPLEIQVFSPLSTASSPSTRAAQLIAATSEPASGSDSAKAAMAVPRATLAQVAVLLRRRAVQRDRARAQALHREGKVGQPRMPRQRLAHQAQCARVQHLARAAIGRAGHRMAQPAGCAERGHQFAAVAVDVGVRVLRDVLARPGVQLALHLDMARFEERPVQVAVVAHVSPWLSCPRRWASASRQRRDRRGRSPRSACTAPGPGPRPRWPGRRPSPIRGAACSW